MVPAAGISIRALSPKQPTLAFHIESFKNPLGGKAFNGAPILQSILVVWTAGLPYS